MLNKLISFVKKNKALDVVTNSTDPTSFFTNLVEVYKEGKRTELEIEQLRLKKEVLLTEIEKKYDFYHPDNVFVWDGKDKNGLEEFIQRPYFKIDCAIREKYGFKNWIHYVLNIRPYQSISLV